MARLGYPKAFFYVIVGLVWVLLLRDVVNGTPEPLLASLFGHRIASLLEIVVLLGSIVYLVANLEMKGK